MTSAVDTLWINVPASGGSFEAYLALPPNKPAGVGGAGGRSGPGLVLFQEIFGVNEHIRALAEMYALDGFVVLVPDVFWRQSPRIELGYGADDRAQGIALASAMKPEQTMLDLRAAVEALRGLPQTAGAKVGAIGWCMGGRLAYMTAALAEIDCAVSYYGGGIHDQLHLASGVTGPMLFHYAERDDHIPLAAVARVREAFAGKPCELHVYDGAAHGFACWERPSYHPAHALLAHARTLAFLSRHLL